MNESERYAIRKRRRSAAGHRRCWWANPRVAASAASTRGCDVQCSLVMNNHPYQIE